MATEEALDAALLSFSESRAAQERALAGLGSRAEARALRALHLLGKGDLDGAKAVELGGTPAERAAEALVVLQSGEIDPALAALEKALDAAPDDPIVLLCAVPLLLLEDVDRALLVARRGVALRPHDPASTSTLIHALGAVGETAEIQATAENPPPAFAGTPGHLVLRSSLAELRGDLDAAEVLAREAVASASDAESSWLRLAEVLRAQDRREEAEQAARFALQTNPRSYRSLFLLSRIANKRGDEAEARRLEAEARALNPIDELMRPLQEVRRLFQAGRHEDMIDALGRLDALPPFARRGGERLRLMSLARVGGTAELRQAVESATGDGIAITLARAELWMRDGRYSDARSILEAAWADGRPPMVAQFLLKALAHDDMDAARGLARELAADPPGSLIGCLGVTLSLVAARMEAEHLAFLEAASRRFPHSRTLLRLRIKADMAYLRIVKAWNDCDGLDPEERKRVRRQIFSFTLRKVAHVRWRQTLKRLKVKG